MTYPQVVTAELFDKTGTLMPAVDLSAAFDINFYDEANGPGTGELAINLTEAAALELTPGRFVNIMLDSVDVFTFKIEGNPEYNLVQRGEEVEQVVRVQGRGWGCVLDEGIIYPSAELGAKLDHSWNLYSFAHPDFPNTSSWAAAVEVYDWLDGVTAGRGRTQQVGVNVYPSPINFPWAISPDNYDVASPPGVGYEPTYWIWSDTGFPNEEYQIGWCFFRKDLTLGSDTLLTFDITADNFFTFFVDGVPLLGENDDHLIWQGWKSTTVALSAGTYTLAAVVENVGFRGQTGPLTGNPGGFLMAAYTNSASGAPSTLYATSDDSWSCEFVSNLARWPAWTPGQIVSHMINAAATRGALAQYDSSSFGDLVDTNSDAWRPLLTDVDTPYMSFAFDVGSTILDALSELYEAGWINWHVQPGTLILDVYRGREPTPSSAATYAQTTDPSTSNITSYIRAETEKYANALLVQWEGGFVEVEDASAIAAHGSRVEDIYSSDAPSEQEATEHGENELLRRAQEGLPAIVMGISPTSSADAPYEGFDLLDWVTVPAVGGGTEVVRVQSIRCAQDSEGFAEWTLELNSKIRVQEREQIELLRQIGGRSQVVRGRAT